MLSVLGQRRWIAWRNIDHLELHDEGLFLCARPQPASQAVLDTFFLPWGKERTSIAEFCEQYRPLAEQGESHPVRPLA